MISSQLRFPADVGDVLVVHGDGNLARIGTSGGFMGHVLLVVAAPVILDKDCEEVQMLRSGWPRREPLPTAWWKISTVESCRGKAGLHRSDMIVCSDVRSGRLQLVAEVSNVEFSHIDREEVHVWQSPRELRSQLRVDLFNQALTEIAEQMSDWSFTTAARAVLLPASDFHSDDKKQQLKEIKSSWAASPICTSVVVGLWQRYLCLFAKEMGWSACDVVTKWMPLKADRTLPGDLTNIMQECGWTKFDLVQSTPIRL